MILSYFYVAGFFSELLKDLQPIEHKYYIFGIQLEIPLSKIQQLETEHQRDSTRIFPDLIDYVLSNFNKDDLMERLFSALVSMDQCVLSEKMRNKYTPVAGN